MQTNRYKVKLSSQIQNGFEHAEVIEKISNLFKKDQAFIHKLLSCNNTIIKQGLDRATALKYKSKLEATGAIINVEKMSSSKINSKNTTSLGSAPPSESACLQVDRKEKSENKNKSKNTLAPVQKISEPEIAHKHKQLIKEDLNKSKRPEYCDLSYLIYDAFTSFHNSYESSILKERINKRSDHPWYGLLLIVVPIVAWYFTTWYWGLLIGFFFAAILITMDEILACASLKEDWNAFITQQPSSIKKDRTLFLCILHNWVQFSPAQYFPKEIVKKRTIDDYFKNPGKFDTFLWLQKIYRMVAEQNNEKIIEEVGLEEISPKKGENDYTCTCCEYVYHLEEITPIQDGMIRCLRCGYGIKTYLPDQNKNQWIAPEPLKAAIQHRNKYNDQINQSKVQRFGKNATKPIFADELSFFYSIGMKYSSEALYFSLFDNGILVTTNKGEKLIAKIPYHCIASMKWKTSQSGISATAVVNQLFNYNHPRVEIGTHIPFIIKTPGGWSGHAGVKFNLMNESEEELRTWKKFSEQDFHDSALCPVCKQYQVDVNSDVSLASSIGLSLPQAKGKCLHCKTKVVFNYDKGIFLPKKG